MRVVLFGATGMLGSGALIECLAHPDVEEVLTVGRRPTGATHEKVTELVQEDFLDLSGAVEAFRGFDACLYCLGVSSAGMSEADYHRVTHDFTVAAADALLKANPEMKMCFISGAATDSSEKGRVMWARVKGKAENAILGMGFGSACVFRPGYVQPLKGVRSRTALYNAIYAIFGLLHPVLKRIWRFVTDTEVLGLALIRAARDGAPAPILESRDINRVGEAERADLERRAPR